ncbi:MAG: NrfD/PsrC family molybdoenzyme membrane anchor subunit, partial [Pseudomonadota bacterium]
SRWDARPVSDALLARLARLLAIFVAAALYFVAVFHLTKLYMARYDGVTRFILLDGGLYTALFWLGQVAAGGLIPLALLFHPRLATSRAAIATACLLVIGGGLAQMYVTIIGGQAYPLALFPGMQETSSFFDGEIHPYAPSAWEVLLGLGGVALALALVAVGLRVLRILPGRLDDEVIAVLENK